MAVDYYISALNVLKRTEGKSMEDVALELATEFRNISLCEFDEIIKDLRKRTEDGKN